MVQRISLAVIDTNEHMVYLDLVCNVMRIVKLITFIQRVHGLW